MFQDSLFNSCFLFFTHFLGDHSLPNFENHINSDHNKMSICSLEDKWKWKSLSCVWLIVTYGILQDRILEWIAFPFSRGTSQPRDWTQASCICRQILYQLSHKGSHGFHLKILDYPKSILIFSTNFICSNIITNYSYWSKEKTILKKYSSYSGAIRTLLKHITLNGLPHKERRKKK